MVERAFADRLLADAAVSLGGIASADDLRLALGYLEGQLAVTNTVGVIHASPEWASREFGLVVASGTALRTPLGHLWIFGGGYVEGLGDTIVATSPVFGWRDEVALREAMDYSRDLFAVVAERSVLVAYEAVVAAVTVAEGS